MWDWGGRLDMGLPLHSGLSDSTWNWLHMGVVALYLTLVFVICQVYEDAIACRWQLAASNTWQMTIRSVKYITTANSSVKYISKYQTQNRIRFINFFINMIIKLQFRIESTLQSFIHSRCSRTETGPSDFKYNHF